MTKQFKKNVLALYAMLISVCIFLIIPSINSFAGIYRHDVPVQKYLDYANESRFDCVGKIYKADSVGNLIPSGTCVLIGSRYVLSAAHCFLTTINERKKSFKDIKGNNVSVASSASSSFNADPSGIKIRLRGKDYVAKNLVVHPSYKPGASDGYEYDLVMVELEEEVKEITPAKLYTKQDELGKIVTGVGYGATGPANDPAEIKQEDKKLAGQNTIDTFMSSNKINGHSIAMYMDFDPPEELDGCNRYGLQTPTPMEYICTGGDSGGGLFYEENGQWFLIGCGPGGGVNINQLVKSGYYCQTMRWLRVSLFNDWITGVMVSDGRER